MREYASRSEPLRKKDCYFKGKTEESSYTLVMMRMDHVAVDSMGFTASLNPQWMSPNTR